MRFQSLEWRALVDATSLKKFHQHGMAVMEGTWIEFFRDWAVEYKKPRDGLNNAVLERCSDFQ
ncbi:hypothetical protein [Paraburkholderia heleia]|uniref:hypothetical protein n=1 Tax=Paraburkholderia heleia TaxID=634127 RepID=UPI002AB7BB3C|nr:hypothetical protein [Paraburkholderia heleia]